MSTTLVQPIFTSQELLKHWQGHRSLTRRVIEAFPEKELFEFSIGGMRTFADLVKELLGIAVPGVKQIVTNEENSLNEKMDDLNTKAALLKAWDDATDSLNQYYPQITEERFKEEINLFGQYKNSVIDSIFYFIDNEIHHRGQGYVYLRALNVEPPFFWER